MTAAGPLDLRGRDVRLLVGVRDPSGNVARDARLRKLTGHEEELLYDPTLSAGRLITELLRRCVTALGDLPTPLAPELVWQLTVADRDLLLVELRRHSLGDRLRALYTCPSCGAEVAVDEDLAQIPTREAGEHLQVTVRLVDGYLDRSGVLHDEVVLRAPTGEDQDQVLRMTGHDPLRARDALLLRCIVRFGKLRRAELEGLGLKLLRDLTLGDRRAIFQAMEEQLPGVDFRRRARCGACGGRFETVLDATDFFGPGQAA